MAERRATPRARLTISCLESEWERIREVAESRGVSINDHVISAGLNVELGPAQTDAPALALSEAEQRRLLDRVDRLAESMLSAASGGSIERLLQSVELLLMTTLHDLARQGRSRELGPLLEAVFGPDCCSARGLRADRRDKLLKWRDTGGQNCTPNNRLGKVVDGWLNYYAVPTSFLSLSRFADRLTRLWLRCLRRRCNCSVSGGYYRFRVRFQSLLRGRSQTSFFGFLNCHSLS